MKVKLNLFNYIYDESDKYINADMPYFNTIEKL